MDLLYAFEPGKKVVSWKWTNIFLETFRAEVWGGICLYLKNWTARHHYFTQCNGVKSQSPVRCKKDCVKKDFWNLEEHSQTWWFTRLAHRILQSFWLIAKTYSNKTKAENEKKKHIWCGIWEASVFKSLLAVESNRMSPAKICDKTYKVTTIDVH